MSGGKITDNSAVWNGGGVCVSISSAFDNSGGKISDNTANTGDDIHYLIYNP
jgi:hypothetical protein